MNPRSILHLKALGVLLAAVCMAVAGGDLIAREQASPLELRHGYRLIIYGKGGAVLSIDELLDYEGNLRWEITNDEVSNAARRLLVRGRQAAARGDFDTALDLFDEAHQNVPGWEYPVSEAAYVYLMQGNEQAAYDAYRRVDTLAPHGFFNSQQAVHCLKREFDGEVPQGTYRRLLMLERASASAARLTARTIVMDTPDYAAGWERVAYFAEDSKTALEAVKKGLAADPDPFTRDSLKFRRAVIAHNDGDTRGAIQRLERLLKQPDLSIPVEAQIKILLPGLRKSLENPQQ